MISKHFMNKKGFLLTGIILVLSCFLFPLSLAAESLADVEDQIAEKMLERDEAQNNVRTLSKTVRDKQSEASSVDLQIRRTNLKIRKLKVLGTPEEAEAAKRDIIRMEIEIDNLKRDLSAIQADVAAAEKQKANEEERLATLQKELESLESKRQSAVAANKSQSASDKQQADKLAQQKAKAEEKAAEKARKEELAREKAEQKAREKQAAEEAAAERKAQAAIQKAEKKQLAKEQAQSPVAAQQTAAEKAAEEDRLAQEQARQQALRRKQEAQEAADQADFAERRKAAIAEARRKAVLEKFGKTVDEADAEEEGDVEQDDASQLSTIRQKQADLKAAAARMRPAQAALNYALARALEPTDDAPHFGPSPDIGYAQPPGSDPKNLGKMTHLGNSQYKLQVPVVKGQQEFVVGEHRFFRVVPDHFHNDLALLLIDGANPDNPQFQIFIVD